MSTSPGLQRYSGQTILITGAAQGLGSGMAERFAREGGAVVAADVNAAQLAVLVKELAEAEGLNVTAAHADVTDPAGVAALVAEAHAWQGRLDVVISNAGIIRDNRIENISDDDWRQVLDVSLSASFYLARAAVPLMRDARYGRFLALSSMSWRGNYGQANYVAAKAGIVGLVRAVALEGARHGITANAIAPGLIDTPMLASMDSRARDKLIARIPSRRTGTPAELAEAAAFLCSPSAAYITGVVLDVDGGIGIGASLR